MQTRGKLVGALMGKVNKDKLAEFNPSTYIIIFGDDFAVLVDFTRIESEIG